MRDCAPVPAVLLLVREEEERSWRYPIESFSSMSEAKEVASFWRRHHLVADDIEVKVISMQEYMRRW